MYVKIFVSTSAGSEVEVKDQHIQTESIETKDQHVQSGSMTLQQGVLCMQQYMLDTHTSEGG